MRIGTQSTPPTANAAMRASFVMVALAMPVAMVVGRVAVAIALGLGLLAALVAWSSQSRRPVFGRHDRTVLIGMGCLVLAWLPSVATSLKPLASLGSLLQTVSMVLIWVLASAALREDHNELAARTFLAGLCVALISALTIMILAPPLIAFRLHGGTDPIPLFKSSASVLACAIPLVLLLGWRLNGWWRWCAVAVIGMSIVVMVKTHSRSSLAGLLAAVLLLGIMMATRHWPLWRRAALACAALAAAAIALHWALASTTPDTIGGYPTFAPAWLVDHHRQVIWQFALDLFRQHPWTGWGPGVISSAPGANQLVPGFVGAEYIPSHTHNWIIQILSETGLVGAIPLVAVVMAVPIILGRSWIRTSNPATIISLGIWVVYWSANLFNFSIWNTWWQAHLAILMALATRCAEEPKK